MDNSIAAWVSLDWADEEHVGVLQEVGSETKERFTIKQTAEALSDWLASLAARFHERKVAVILEQSRGALIACLMSCPFLILYPVNPRSLAKFREALRLSGAKDDPSDADFLLVLLRSHGEKLRAWHPDDEQTRAMALLVESRRKLVEQRVAIQHRLRDRLKQVFPQILQWFKSLEEILVLDLLSRWSTLQQCQSATDLQLRKFLSAYRRRNKEQFMRDLIQQIRVARPLCTDKAILNVFSMDICTAVKQLQSLHESINEYETKIAELFDAHPDHDLFASLPGAGAALAPRLLVAFGSDRNRFDSAAAVQQFCGIAPITKKSGKTKIVECRWACPKFIRQTFHEFAQQSIAYSRWAKAYYQSKREAGKGHHAAIRALAFKWIRILYCCWKKRVRYDEDVYIASLERRNSPLAKKLKAA